MGCCPPLEKLNISVQEEGWTRSCSLGRSCVGGSGKQGNCRRGRRTSLRAGVACFPQGAESRSADVPDSRLFGGSGNLNYPRRGMWSVHMTAFCCDSSALAKYFLVTTSAISGPSVWPGEECSPCFLGWANLSHTVKGLDVSRLRTSHRPRPSIRVKQTLGKN